MLIASLLFSYLTSLLVYGTAAHGFSFPALCELYTIRCVYRRRGEHAPRGAYRRKNATKNSGSGSILFQSLFQFLCALMFDSNHDAIKPQMSSRPLAFEMKFLASQFPKLLHSPSLSNETVQNIKPLLQTLP